ncbi:MAG TPA: alpha/beta hydrolase [Aliidongia sp.]|nr:alpha/beta hydrolase [Aliidongia sp.]
MHPIHHRFVDSNGIRMHLAEQGEGPAVILCHGWPESWYSWRHQMAALAEAGYRAIAPDQRGYGQTEAPAAVEAYHMLNLTADIVGMVDALGIEQATIAGHDWGSPVAWNCALLRPDIFRRLILLSVPYLQRRWNAPRPTDMMQRLGDDEHEYYQAYFQEPGRAETALEADVRGTFVGLFNGAFGNSRPGLPMVPKKGGFIEGLGGHGGALPDWITEADIDFYVREYSRTGFRGGLNWYRNIDRLWELGAVLSGARIRQSSLFIAGGNDTVVRDMHPDAFATLEETMPGLTKKVLLPGAGHWVQQERAAEVSALMLEFLQRTNP